jgi:hypothetical protein
MPADSPAKRAETERETLQIEAPMAVCGHCRRTIIGDQWCIRRIAPLRCEPYGRATADPYEDGDLNGHNNGRAYVPLNWDPNACSDPPEESCSDAGCPRHGYPWGPVDGEEGE